MIMDAAARSLRITVDLEFYSGTGSSVEQSVRDHIVKRVALIAADHGNAAYRGGVGVKSLTLSVERKNDD